MATNMATLFARGNLCRSKFLEQPQSLGQETWPLENSNLGHIILLFDCFSAIPTDASNDYFLSPAIIAL
jgi:hypothetical protein